MVQLNHPQLGKVEATDVDFESADEEWREYELADGTTLKVKTIVNKVLRIEDHPDQLGQPMYHIGTQNIVRTSEVPEDLVADTEAVSLQGGQTGGVPQPDSEDDEEGSSNAGDR